MSPVRMFAYHIFDIIGIGAVIYCLYINFWIMLAVLVGRHAISTGAKTGLGMDGGSFAMGAVVVAALIYDPVLFMVTLIATTLWRDYGPAWQRGFREDNTGSG